MLLRLFCILLGLYSTLHAQSVFKDRIVYKLAIPKSGVYKIDQTFLKTYGIVGNIRTAKVYSLPGGMLPQSNDSSFFTQPQELPLEFGADYLLFYATGADELIIDTANQKLSQKTNLYSDLNYCFLTFEDRNPKTLTTHPKHARSVNTLESFDTYIYFEEEETNLLTSGRAWFSKPFFNKDQRNFDYNLTDVNLNKPFKFDLKLLYNAFSLGRFEIEIQSGNTTDKRTVRFTPLVDDRYKLRGRTKILSTIYPNLTSPKLTLAFTFFVTPNPSNRGFIDYFNFNYQQNLIFRGTPLICQAFESRKYPKTTFLIRNANPNLKIWDITKPLQPFNCPIALESDRAFITLETYNLKRFIVFDPQNLPEPIFDSKLNPQDINNFETPNLLIITTENLRSSAERLANFRRQHDKFKVEVLTTDQIYNAYASGRQDISALRNCIRHYYLKDGKTLRYVLLFGDASYDYKNRIDQNTNFVPTYQSSESLLPLATYSSDDFYGFLEAGEGNWAEVPTQNHTLDIGLGRLPVSNLANAEALVTKIINYYNQKDNLGSWRTRISFVADNGDGYIHQNQAHSLGLKLEEDYSNLTSRRLFVDAYPRIATAGGTQVPQLKADLERTLAAGSLIINFTGHGDEKQWTSENIFNAEIAKNLNNTNRLALFLTATCEFGRFDDPEIVSGAELGLLNPNGGAIGFLATTRPVFSATNFITNQAFSNAIVNNEKQPFLGDLIRETKNNSVAGVNNRNFTLLGDPSLRLVLPPNGLKILRLNDKTVDSNLDTLKALQKVKLEGQIERPNFNGFIDISAYGKPIKQVVVGRESTQPFTYSTSENLIFKGIVPVKNSQFSVDLIIPKSINYQFGRAKFVFYAYNQTKTEDLAGHHSFILGGSERPSVKDNTAPFVRAVLDVDNFEDGQAIGPNPILIARLSDENGINLTSSEIHGLQAILDGKTTFKLANFYLPDTGTYQSGSLEFPLKNLTVGKHQLVLQVSDNYNNQTEKILNFEVDANLFKISNFILYPNPAADQVNFKFEHNFSGQELDFSVVIYDLRGNRVGNLKRKISNAPSIIKDLRWNFKGLASGFYLCYFEIGTGGSIDKFSEQLFIE